MLASQRQRNFAGFAACAAMMAYALYSQHGLGLEPCPLCIFQRVSVIGLGVIFLVAALHAPGRFGSRVYAALLGVTALAGAVVAGRHVWLQHLPPERVPACGPGLDFMLEALPFTEMLQKVFSGSGECAKVDWSLLGLSMPGWVFISVVVLGACGIWNNGRQGGQPSRRSRMS